jgi:OOP family OmpA-OmpF porin
MRLPARVLSSLCLVALAAHADAAPIVISGSQASGNPRRDSGQGLCTSAVHLNAANMLSNVSAATFFLSQSVGMNNVDAKLTRAVPMVHFTNGVAAASSDFAGAQLLPFSAFAAAPNPSDGQNTAMRVRGYINIKKAGVYTFGVQADDGYALSIAGVPITQSTQTDVALRDSQQVQFDRPGLYSVQLTYFQQSAAAVLSWVRSEQAEVELRASTTRFPASYAVVPQDDLHSAVAGTSSCTECVGDTDCGGGQYCGAGLCQSCADSSHCGASCSACPAEKPICDGTSCGPCTSDLQCLEGQICDSALGGCIPRPSLQFAGGCSAGLGSDPKGHSTAGALALLVGLFALLFFSRRKHGSPGDAAAPSLAEGCRGGRPSNALSALLLAAALAVPATAKAQNNPQFNAQTFRPDLGPGSAFSVQGSSIPRSILPFGGVVFEYANRPLRMFDVNSGQNYANTVSGMLTAHVMPGIAVARFLALMVDVPIVLFQGFDGRTPFAEVPLQPTAAGLGDVRAWAKLQAADNHNGGFGVALTAEFSFPTGSAQSFRGEGTTTILPRLVIDYRFAGNAFVAINAGYLIRTSNRYVDYGLVRVTDHLRYGLGIGVPLVKGLMALGEIAGAFSFSRIEGGPFYAPLEGLLGLRYRHRKGIEATVGAGGDFTNAVGWPNVRVLGSIAFIPQARRAAAAATPAIEEDPPRPDPTAEPGERPSPPGVTPPPPPQPTPVERKDEDRDQDGVPDREDACPKEAGPVETKGCPDADRDGIPDKQDQCPSQAGVAAKKGCPDNTDTDKDGVLDRDDQCPIEPGIADNRGCPDRDEDRDGIVDRLDKCPKAPGSKEDDGCPLMEMQDDTIKLARPIRFMQDSVTIESGSRPALAAVAKAIRDDKSLKNVVMEVSASGDKKAAKGLAKKRAQSLQKLLVDAGISKKVLKVKAAKEIGSDEVSKIELLRVGGKAAGGSDAGAEKPGRRHHRRSKK